MTRYTGGMDPQSLVIILRMLERILGVLIGGVLIYFGYRLFLDLRGRRERRLHARRWEQAQAKQSRAGGFLRLVWHRAHCFLAHADGLAHNQWRNCAGRQIGQREQPGEDGVIHGCHFAAGK